MDPRRQVDRRHFPTLLAQLVWERRSPRGLKKVAAEVGVSVMTLSRVERGAFVPSPETVAALARWLGATEDEVWEAVDLPPVSRPARAERRRAFEALRLPVDVDAWRGEGLERPQAWRADTLSCEDAAAFSTWLRTEGWRWRGL